LKDPGALQKRLGYRFADSGLLIRALTHRSVSSDHLDRLEFLGDAVLSLAISEYLWRKFPDAGEGQLSRWRSHLVCRESLKRVAHDWQLHAHVHVGAGERDSHGSIRSESILADSLEAILGAVFVDGGWEAARNVVLNAWSGLTAHLGKEDMQDAKSRLQELTQSRAWGVPEYRVMDHGAGKDPRFTAICYVRGKRVGRGHGGRKKLAESEAAREAWRNLQESDGKG
jgi:ribonuclease-3